MKKIAKIAVAVLVVAAVFAAALPAAKAATVAELEATIKALQAQIAALGGGSAGSASANYAPFTKNLSLGSRGDDVARLQQYLEEGGYLTMPAGASYGYFGKLTQKALIAYQKDNDITPASGYFGPKTRAVVNADLEARAAASETASTTPSTPEVGSTTAPTVMQGDGSLTATVKSSPSDGQTVKKGETKDVMALEFKATGGDVSVNRIKLKFDKRPWLYFGKVTLKDDAGNVIAEKALDASSVEEVTSGSDYRVSFDGFTPIVVKQGEKKTATVSVSALASTDKTDTAIVISATSSDSIRTVNGKGYTETLGADKTRTVSFKASTAGNLVVTQSADTPKAKTAQVKANSETTEITLGKFDLKAENRNVTVKHVGLALNSASATSAIYEINLYDPSGNKFSGQSSSTLTNGYEFTDIDYVVPQDQRVSFTVKAKFKSKTDIGDAFSEGMTVKYTSVTVGAEDSAYDPASVSGSADSYETALYSQSLGVVVTGKRIDTQNVDNKPSKATGYIEFKVTAGDDPVYVLKLNSINAQTTASTTAGVEGKVNDSTNTGFSQELKTVDADEKTYSYLVPAGADRTFRWNFSIELTGTSTGVFRQAIIDAIHWATTDSDSASNSKTYNYNMTDFKSDSVSLSK